MRGVTLLLAMLFSAQVFTQQAPSGPVPLSPSEAMKSARAPFDAARAQADDLTQADALALHVGMAQAARDCAALQPQLQSYAAQSDELLSLAHLCMFGQQFEPARATLVAYLVLPQTPERETALLLLVQAFLGLKAPGSAVAQELSLLRDYPYDAQIDLSVDSVIDAAEAEPPPLNDAALQLCGKQNAATLPLLESQKGLSSKDADVTPSKLFADAIRCATLDRMSGDIALSSTLQRLKAIAAQPGWQGTAQYAPMQEALAQSALVTQAPPAAELRGSRLAAKGLLPKAVRLDAGAIVLMPFVLWAPSSASMIRTLALSVPVGQPLYAVTSWAANTGGDDTPSTDLLEQMQSWQQALPPHVSLLILPDKSLRAFHPATYPAGIVSGVDHVLFNSPLQGDGSVRLLLYALNQAGPSSSTPVKQKAGR